ncbi:aminoacyl-tRNA hydrolase [Leptospira sp. GIMC2001]|uniref:aminoacyl-tRNA hydrolase n=1 Tax=Leptospira sp. GIMC2001 TaxID=1513297 RepID=UPI002349FFF2|nr:aminoacyl-tRNA hydrolase [Leptospira sp. GIMC2001]WCL48201.1 aminoacyl-tRNA hydrolase [Leptospira sp. GIMC2001]
MINHFLIAGLGNPTTRYEKTRHNIGFIVLDSYLSKKGATWSKDKNSVYAKLNDSQITIHFAKPQEYMNLSGKEVARIAKLYKIPVSQILIIHDEIDIPFEKIKNKIGGGTAGHNGLGDIVERLGDNGFHRLRFGVGKPIHPGFAVADFVLQNFSSEENEKLPALLDESCKRIDEWIKERIKVLNKNDLS